MSLLEKIIFTADFASLDRSYKGVKYFRDYAKEDLNGAFFKILTKKIEWTLESKKWLCPQTVRAWNWYVAANGDAIGA
jgi:nicotinate-nucleotide adenylyltransferase